MGLEWISEKASGVLNSVSSAGASLLDSARSLVGSETKSDKPSAGQIADSNLLAAARESVKGSQPPASGSLSIGDAINSAKLTVSAISNIADAVAKVDSSTIKTGMTIAGALVGGPAGALGTVASGLAGIAGYAADLVKVGENSWVSSDQKLKVEKVNAEATAKLHDDFSLLWTDYEAHKKKYCPKKKDETGLVEFTNPYDGNKTQVSAEAIALLMADKLPEQANVRVDGDGKTTVTQVSDTGVQITKTDATGKVITEVEKDETRTAVRHNNETAVRQDGRTLFEKPGIKVTVDQTGSRKVLLGGNRELTRNSDGTATMVDKTTGQTFQISEAQMVTMLRTNQPLVFSNAGDDLDKLTEQVRRGLQPGQTGVLVMEGLGTRTVFHDGTIMDVRADRTARIQTTDGDVLILDKRGRVYLKRDGMTERLSTTNLPQNIQFRNGRFVIKGIEVNADTLQMFSRGMVVDVLSSTACYTNGDQTSTVTTNTEGVTKVTDGNKTLTNAPGGIVTVATETRTAPNQPPKLETVTINLNTTEVKTPLVTDTRESTVINETGTVIHSDGKVEFDRGQGPVLNTDGSVKVDEQTYIDKDMNVTSGDWHSSPKAYAEAVLAEKKAATVAHDVSGIVGSVLGKTVVKWNDVQTLNSALSDITGLLGRIPPDSPAFARLKEAYGLVMQALAYATPKAQDNAKLEQLQKRAA